MARYHAGMAKPAPKLTKEAVLECMNRPWHIFVQSRLEAERERYERDPGSSFAASEDLTESVRVTHGTLDPRFDREDFEDLICLRRVLERVGRDHKAR